MRNEIEVMRVLRVPPLGKLVVEFKTNRYQTIGEVAEENVNRLLLTAIGELIVFAGGYQNLVDAGVAPPLTAPAASEANDQALDRQQETFVASLEAERDRIKGTPPPKPKFQILAGYQPRLEDKPAAPAALKSGSLVEQIDAILQRHLKADAALAQRAIHLVQDPGGGLQISVDGQTYDRPSAIDDERIQLVIKRALKEWESA